MIYVVGIGPGSKDTMTLEAIKAIEDSEAIVGYKTYIKLIEEFIQDKEIIQNGMRQEVDRCKQAVEEAKKGKKVAANLNLFSITSHGVIKSLKLI